MNDRRPARRRAPFYSVVSQGALAALPLAIALLASSPASAQTPLPDAAAPTASADANPTWLTPEAIVELVLRQSPDLERARIEEERARELVISEEYGRTPIFSADAGYRYGQFPDLSAQGTRLIDSSALSLAGRLSHTLPIGTRIALSASLNRAVRDSVVLGDLGVAYDAGIAAEITQPLLRGAGRDVVDAALLAARRAEQLRRAQNDELTSALLYESLITYWDLWLAQRSLEIQEGARRLAEQSLQEATVRLEAGAAAPADLIPLRIEIARAEESLLAARTQQDERSLALTRQLGLPPDTSLRARADAPTLVDLPDSERALEQYEKTSPELQRLTIALEDARQQAGLARKSARPALDALGSFQLDGLGRSTPEALSQLGRAEGYVAFVGLRLELPIVNRARQADARRAELAVRAAEHDLQQARAEARVTITSLRNEARAARTRAELARHTAALTRENVDAQRARFETGRGTAFEVVDALQRLQEAEARVVTAHLELMRQVLTLQELTGTLLTSAL
ncbi:TolC family protein [Lujinxingia sediminis]|uniref:TolC family protein n=1 Tax=Lujinxingia sediminis TaxID=2480984 RepID=A0ABY0CV24_9DELT|nr:TolC family protein [Lujinxingia sediminis]RVU45921.1 TolC family protein [Lujinxingia sediminis]